MNARGVGRILPRALLALCASAFILACGCGSSGGSGGQAAADEPASKPAASSDAAGSSGATGAPYTQPDSIAVPQTSGGGIDTSGVNDGWVAASANSSSRLKFQVIHGEETYNYDLPNDGTPTIFPINMGNGGYQFRVMQNTKGNSYVEIDSATADASLSSEFAPFLIPNQICSYDASSDCVSTAREITASATNEGEVVAVICTYVADNVDYDFGKADELSKSTGYIPDPDDTLATGEGICFDYASLSAAMLRSMGLPAKVMTGYVGDDQLYHSWIMVYADGTWQTASFSVSPKKWSRCDVTFASVGETSLTGSGDGYIDRYTY